MAEVTVKSTAVTAQDATPRVGPQAGRGGAYRVKEIDEYVAVAATDEDLSVYKFFRVPTTVIVKDLWLEAAALGGSCAANFGVYYPPAGPDLGAGGTAGAAVDADLFGSAIVISSAVLPTNILNESTTLLTSERNTKMLWENAGLSSDPGGKFDIAMVLTVDAAAAGNVYLKMGFVE